MHHGRHPRAERLLQLRPRQPGGREEGGREEEKPRLAGEMPSLSSDSSFSELSSDRQATEYSPQFAVSYHQYYPE